MTRALLLVALVAIASWSCASEPEPGLVTPGLVEDSRHLALFEEHRAAGFPAVDIPKSVER